MRQKGNAAPLIRMLRHYLIFFALVAFVITCCTMLFVRVLATTPQIELTGETLGLAAKMTFVNVLIISLLFTFIDYLRRKLTVMRPLQRITEGAERMMKGDFRVRIATQSRFATDESFNQVIDCFNKMAEELSGVETLRTDFIANVSHEMKTPLAVIQNYGTLLQEPSLDESKRTEYAKAIIETARRLSDMITNILKLNRLENQRIYPEAKEYNLGEQLCECLLQYEDTWERAGIEIETDIAENVIVKADAELLSLVWSNLFSNAFKFTQNGGKVTVTLTASERCAYVKVQDTGCGMTPEVGAHIFEKFYQGDTSHATKGNGLGLALVKRVVDILHGEISVESLVGTGTTFTVRLESAQKLKD